MLEVPFLMPGPPRGGKHPVTPLCSQRPPTLGADWGLDEAPMDQVQEEQL